MIDFYNAFISYKHAPLDSKVAEELNIYVGDIRKFTALPGAVKKSYAVRVTSIVREEEEE